ncbi:DUF6378 domain-containing protein [Ruegeria jejuensis]|uniref:DUF6378 domain-containing protein n=1 Tax=Ruegeria jejuensis TaxID=3233338 RepID=UPI00355B3AEC
MNRAEILSTATEYVTKDRAADHGDMEDNFGRIAGLWTAYLGVDITSVDVSMLMVLLKAARVKSNPNHEDSFIDIAGYAACGGEAATRRPRSNKLPSKT